MEIRNGRVPQFIRDLLNAPEHDGADHLDGRKDDAATDLGVSITERGAADQGTDPRAPVLATQTAPPNPRAVVRPAARAMKAAIYAPVTTPGEEKEKLSELRQQARRIAGNVIEFRERPARANTRPVFSQMMELASRRKFGVIVVESLDCFARSLSELSIKLRWLDQFDVRLMTVEGSIDTDKTTETGRMFVHTLNVLVDAENRMTARKVRAGMDRAKSAGVHCGRPRRSFPIAKARKLREQGLSIRALAARIGVPASTVASALKV